MCDQYYRDTNKALGEVEQIELDLMDSHYSEMIERLLTETGYLLEQYEKLTEERDGLALRLEELE